MKSLYSLALSELGGVFERIDDSDVDRACGMIGDAKKIVVFGGGRERLQIMGFAMRLYHMGLAVAVEGDMTTPPVGKGDLFIVTCGPGEISTALALMSVAKAAGAKNNVHHCSGSKSRWGPRGFCTAFACSNHGRRSRGQTYICPAHGVTF